MRNIGATTQWSAQWHSSTGRFKSLSLFLVLVSFFPYSFNHLGLKMLHGLIRRYSVPEVVNGGRVVHVLQAKILGCCCFVAFPFDQRHSG